MVMSWRLRKRQTVLRGDGQAMIPPEQFGEFNKTDIDLRFNHAEKDSTIGLNAV